MESRPRQSYASVRGLALNGFQVQSCTVEVVIRSGIPDFRITGMAPGQASQSAERVRAAIRSAGLRFPYSRVLVNLAPAEPAKRGSYFDLAIAAAVMRAMQTEPPGLLGRIHAEETLLLGELTLGGRILAPKQLYSFLRHARETGFRELVLAGSAIASGHVIPGLDYFPLAHLGDLLRLPPVHRPTRATRVPVSAVRPAGSSDAPPIRLSEHQRRALLICAAGRHSMLLIGPPGCGKTMLARRVPELLPAPDENEALEIIAVGEVLGRTSLPRTEQSLQPERPFRAPHHTATIRALIGGGPRAEPGEVTRAHRGVLFLDEMAEFSRQALQALREPMEDGVVRLSRGAESADLPAEFLFLAATNPCPCGNYGNPAVRCDCPRHRRLNYLGRITGPLRDRIALEVPMYPAPRESVPLTAAIWQRMQADVEGARKEQRRRYGHGRYRFNGEVPAEHLRDALEFGTQPGGVCEGDEWLRLTGAFSPRVRGNIMRVTRTLADLAGEALPSPDHVREALGYVFPRNS